MDMVREILERAARGSYPAADGRIEVLPAPPGPAMAILGFTAHHVIASAAPEEWVRAELAEGDLSAPLKPRFVSRLAEKLGRHDDSLDLLLVAEGLPGPVTLRETDVESHPRVVRALRHRVDVRAFTDAVEQVVVVLGRGLALRHEVAVEVSDSARSRDWPAMRCSKLGGSSARVACCSRRPPLPTPPRSAACSPPASLRSAPRCCSSRRSRSSALRPQPRTTRRCGARLGTR